jgi:hypothetical protein
MLPVHKVGAALLGLLYAAAAVLVALWGALIGEFHCYNQECPGRDWTEAREAWQWDVIVALALLGGLAGLITVVLAFSVRRLLIARAGFFVHGAFVCISGALLLYAHDLSQVHFVLWLLLVFASGGALFYVRASRQRAGTRPE